MAYQPSVLLNRYSLSSSSSKSDEVRYSLAELDGVITQFEIDLRQQICDLTGHSNPDLPNTSRPRDNMEAQLHLAPMGRSESSEFDFPPPPPPDLPTVDGFQLPPPPEVIPPESLGIADSSAILETACCEKQRLCPASKILGVHVGPIPSNCGDELERNSAKTGSIPSIVNGNVGQTSKRPLVPRRDPSTQLSTVQPPDTLTLTRHTVMSFNGQLCEPSTSPNTDDSSVSCTHPLSVPDQPTNSSFVSPTQPASPGPDTSPMPSVQQLTRNFFAPPADSVYSPKLSNQSTPPILSPCEPNPCIPQSQLGPCTPHITEQPISVPNPIEFPTRRTSTCMQYYRKKVSPIQRPLNPDPNRLSCASPSQCTTDDQVVSDNTDTVHVSIETLNLDSACLDILKQYNITNTSQIPGYQPVPLGIPTWKSHKLMQANREAAKAHADELRKWGSVPQWKRALLEKRSPVAETTSSTTVGARSSPGDSSSSELSRKLQRRLEQIDSSPPT